MSQFVILRHTLPEGSERTSHFDLMLELDGALLTWAIDSLPSAASQTAMELPPHRIDYLTYEGPVSNNRGEVSRVAAGRMQWLCHDPDRYEIALEAAQSWERIKLQRIAGPRWSVMAISEVE